MSIRVEEQELSIMDDMLKALRSLPGHVAQRRVLNYVVSRMEADELEAWRIANEAACKKISSLEQPASGPETDGPRFVKAVKANGLVAHTATDAKEWA